MKLRLKWRRATQFHGSPELIVAIKGPNNLKDKKKQKSAASKYVVGQSVDEYLTDAQSKRKQFGGFKPKSSYTDKVVSFKEETPTNNPFSQDDDFEQSFRNQ